MSPFADPVGLGALDLGLRVVDLVELQKRLVGVSVRRPAVYSVPRSVSTRNTGTL